MKTNLGNLYGDIRMNRKKSAEVIVAFTDKREGRNNNNSEEIWRCGDCDNCRKQGNLAGIKEIVWNTKGMMERIVIPAVK